MKTFLASFACAAALASHPVALAATPGAESPSAGARERAAPAFASDRIVVRAAGRGRDVLLIPGLNSSPRVWRSTVDHLGPGYRVHLVHVRGFAGLEARANGGGAIIAPVADEIARYIREQGLREPTVIGHSMGGTLGLSLAAAHPELVERLMVVDMVPYMGAAFGGDPVAVARTADQMRTTMMSQPDEAYRAQARTNVANMTIAEADLPGLVDDALTSDRRVSANAFHELMTTDLRPRLSRVTAATRVLFIKFNDPRFTLAWTEAAYRDAYRAAPKLELRPIANSAHFIMLDNPPAFFAELDSFLEAK